MRHGPSAGLPALQDILWGKTAPQSQLESDPVFARIQQIVVAAAGGQSTGHADLAVLVRQALAARSTPSQPAAVSVPKALAWNAPASWRRFGLHATDLGDSFLLEALAWRPSWLRASADDRDDIFGDVFRERQVWIPSTVPIDPCIGAVTGFDSYVCPGQREAVRSLLFMPAGSTLIVNLPTGSGKTLVGQVPPLLFGLRAGLTLFVVPTKALALDQERRMKEMLSRAGHASEFQEFAWHAELPEETKVSIKRRVRSGTQGILFTSPESALGALLPALYAAADNGTLRYLVIDEAHIVTEWGDGFRPDFQRLAGLRTGLMKHCRAEKFRTVLMSATLSPDTLALLENLYGPPSETQMVAAVHLRPEPRYWTYRASGRNEKTERVLELLRHAPRPFILYVTEPREAMDWLRVLRGEGFSRLDCFHGRTLGPDRAAIIDHWAKDRLDGIVATSAFGVGMDKTHVPTILHAVVPETLDRYYQEVGRGGRDGTASISVVIYTDRDAAKARLLGRPRLLSGNNAFERWRTMYSRCSRLPDTDLVRIDIAEVPEHLRRQSDHNSAWNVRTLIMMARSRLIELETVPPTIPERAAGEDELDYEARIDKLWERHYGSVTLRTLEPGHQQSALFDEKTRDDRTRAEQGAQRTFDSLMAVLEGRREMSSELIQLYQNHAAGRTVIVSPACRGCPIGHAPTDLRSGYQVPTGGGIIRTTPFDLTIWAQRFPGYEGTMAVHFNRDVPELRERLRAALRAAVSVFGIPEVVAPAYAWRSEPWMKQLHTSAPSKILIARILEEELASPCITELPRATLLWHWTGESVPGAIPLLDRPLHVFFFPSDLKGYHPLRRYIDTADHTIALERFVDVATR